MELNPDQDLRDYIIWPNGYTPQWYENEVKEGDPPPYMGGITHFNISLDILSTLVLEGFVDVEECQNESPSIEEFMVWVSDVVLKHPKMHDRITFTGYAVTKDRPDYRVSVEGLKIKGPVPKKVREAFKNKFKTADEYECKKTKCRCWYD